MKLIHKRETSEPSTPFSLQDGKWFGSNTDSIGALNAIERNLLVKAKHIVILGAGGAAKAIAYEAARRGAFVTVVNRDEARAEQVAMCVNGKAKGIDRMTECKNEGYDILINCTPADMPIKSEDILSNADRHGYQDQTKRNAIFTVRGSKRM